jgi:hypothetical protein
MPFSKRVDSCLSDFVWDCKTISLIYEMQDKCDVVACELRPATDSATLLGDFCIHIVTPIFCGSTVLLKKL